MDDLKYRKRMSTSIDKGLYLAIYNYSVDSRIPLSRLMDEAIEDLLKKKNVNYQIEFPKEKIKQANEGYL